ncbi:prolyl-tRNA synthetase [bacterium]|nr:MAG: prolyl-tRNA synthetase [bacterium]
MTYTKNFIKTKKEISSEIESKNAQLLIKGGFIRPQMAGVYIYLPLGLRVLEKITNVVRKHMDEIASEMRMTALQPRDIWEKTNRLDTVDVLMKTIGANEVSKQKSTNEYILGCTHEDVLTNMLTEFVQGESELPIYVYQIQNKFRNEARAKSGLMRGREFLMKDLYSFHTTYEDLMRYYEIVKQKYIDIFEELGIGNDTFVTLASGGDFTDNFSHEFQMILESGEDEILIDRTNKIAYNLEILDENKAKKVDLENANKLGVDFSKLEKVKASEVGNIFPNETKYSKLLNLSYTNSDGVKKYVHMGSYGIGVSRLMGVIAEKFHDPKGLTWPENVAPFKYHICTLAKSESELCFQNARKFYVEHETESLWDDRFDTAAGEKFADADLIGCPVRIVFSERNPDGEFTKR